MECDCNAPLTSADVQEFLQKYCIDGEYNPTSPRPQSGLAVADAIKDLATKDQLSLHANDKNVHFNGTEHQTFVDLADPSTGIVARLNRHANNEEVHLTQADRDTYLNNWKSWVDAEKKQQQEIDDHVSNRTVHITADERDNWNDKYRRKTLDTKFTDVNDRLEKLEAVRVDQHFVPNSENAQSGSAVAEGFKEFLASDILDQKVREHAFAATAEQQAKWNDKYTIHEVDLKLAQLREEINVDGKIQALKESLDIDGKLANLKDSLRLDDRFANLKTQLNVDGKIQALKDSLNVDAKLSQLKDSLNIDGRLQALRDSLNVDGKIENLKSQLDVDYKISRLRDELNVEPKLQEFKDSLKLETRLADLKKQILQDAQLAYKDFVSKSDLLEHANDQSVHVTVPDKVSWNDKYTIHEVDLKLSQLKDQITKETQINTDGFATKDELNEHEDDTLKHVSAMEKSTWNDKYTTREVDQKLQEINKRIDPLENIQVDQVYSPYSTHAQSGHAVAGAVAELVTKETFAKHLDNPDMHTSNTEKARWNDKYTKEEVDALLAKKVGEDAVAGFADRIEDVEDAIAAEALKTLTNAANLATHASDTVIHITSDDRVRWDSAITTGSVDHAFNPESRNPQSGLAVEDAIKDLATKAALAAVDTKKADAKDLKAVQELIPDTASSTNKLVDESKLTDMIHRKHAHFRGSWATYADIPTDSTQYPQDVDGNHKPLKDDYLVVIKDENHEGHTWEYRYTGVWDTNGKESWKAIYEITSSPLTTEQFAALDSGITAELVGKITQNETDIDALEGRLNSLESDSFVVDQNYNGESKHAQSGTAVAEALRGAGFATKTEVTALDNRVDSVESSISAEALKNRATEAELQEHKADTTVHVSEELREKLEQGYSKEDLDGKLDGVTGRLDALEAKPDPVVDQTYNKVSENAQSGKAVAQAIDQQRTIQNAGNTAYMSNETTGGIIKFLKANGEGGKVTTYDGSDSDGTYVQISTFNQDKSQVAKINMTLTGAYYSKASSGAVAVADNELLTKKDIKDVATKTELAEKADQSALQSLTERVETVEAVTVDQTYNGESTNAQSGTAVAEAIKDLATKTEVAEKAAQSDLDTLDGRVDALEAKPEPTVDQTYNGESTNAQSGTAVAEAIKDLATKAEVAEKAAQTDLDTLDGRVDALEAKPDPVVDQTYNKVSENAQSGKAVAEAIQQQRVIENEGNTAYMSNETTGGIIKFTKSTGEIAKVTTFDGSDSEQTFIQLVTQNGDKSKTAKINFTLDGAFYSKASSGAVAVADNELVTKKDIKDVATKTELAEKAAQSDLDTLDGRVDALEAKPEPTVDQTYNGESTNAQSGTAVAEAIKDLATKTELADKADKTVVDEVVGKVPAEASAENQLADKAYVDDRIRTNSAHFRGSWPTKAAIPSTVDDYPQDVNGSKTPEKNDYLVVLKDETHENHTWEYRYTGVWDTNGVDGWTAVYEISANPLTDAQIAALDSGITSELVQQIGQKANQSDLDTLDGRVDALEAKPEPTVDQTYDAESTNAQSGTAVAEAIKDLATKTEVAEKADQSALQSLTERVETVEAVEVDQTYNGESTNAQSGTAVAEAIADLATKTEVAAKADTTTVTDLGDRVTALEEKPEPTVDQTYNNVSENAQSGKAVAEAIQKQRVIESEGNTAYMSNETTGGVIKFTKSTGEFGKLTTCDGSDSEHTYVQIVASNQDKSQIAKINMTLTGAYYSKEGSGSVAVSDNELVTKKDIKDIASNTTLTELSGRVEALEAKPEPTVDQTYDAESTNAQSGTAVADAVKDLATKTEVAAKADTTTVTDLGDRVTALEEKPEITVDQTYNGESVNPQSGTAVAEAIKDLATKTEVAAKADQTELQSLIERVETVEAVTVDQTYSATSANAQSGKAVAEAIKDLASKTEMQEAIDAKVESVLHYKGQVATQGELPGADQVMGDVYNVEDTGANYAWNGTSWDKLSEDLSGFASKTELTTLSGRVETLEAVEVDQTYNGESTNAQSGTAVAEAISDLATKTEVAAKADTTTVTDLGDRVTALEEKPEITVDQAYAAASANPQSGTAVKGALDTVKVSIATDDGAAATFQSIKVYDATEAPELATREENVLYLEVGDEVPIIVDQTYNGTSTNPQSGKAVAQAISGLAATTTVSAIDTRVKALEAVEVDQTYNAASTNAQSGKAVASGISTAIASKANSADLVKLTTDGGSPVVFKSILFFSSADKAPALSERQEGVLYLIGE